MSFSLVKTKKNMLVLAALLAMYIMLRQVNFNQVEDRPVFKNKIFRIAHRCSALLYPENTLFACSQSSKNHQADILEIDVHLTRDKQLVVIHDETVDRTTNGRGKVSSMTLKQLQTLDAGFWFSTNGNTYPFRGKGIVLSALGDFFQQLPDSLFYIELKSTDPAAPRILLEEIIKYRKEKEVIIGSFNPDTLKQLKQENPKLAFFASSAEIRNFYLLSFLGLEGLAGVSSHTFAVPEKRGAFYLTDQFLLAAKRHNIRTHVWTINTTKSLQKLQNKVIDGIMSDNPLIFTQ